MLCSACNAPYHEASGHVLQRPATTGSSDLVVLCGPCAKNWAKWYKSHVGKRWSKGDFYGAANLKPAEGQTEEVWIKWDGKKQEKKKR